MSAFGPKQTSATALHMSPLSRGKADTVSESERLFGWRFYETFIASSHPTSPPGFLRGFALMCRDNNIQNAVYAEIITTDHSRAHHTSGAVLKLCIIFNCKNFPECDVTFALHEATKRQRRPFGFSVLALALCFCLANSPHLGPFLRIVHKVSIVDAFCPIGVAQWR